MSDSSPEEPAEVSADDLLPVKVDVLRVLEIGTALWVIALVLTLVIPALHQDGRDWWPWTCVAGAVLGGIGWAYIKRGRGNASAA
ncbi:MAG TPA: DUF2530 domain-containing protein [Flexivirga sp.]|uniref:DUF2530 domain-containing protein n=1 Tax=Flexivirga sp. TaxID=1962927 RepID=UPI002C4BCB6D|nr:DUF2530 domain-containing protein [Flexivirga sp.]HWC22310.1 DUF2530 domain-containing protein [Flexivirga sp.]